MLSERRSSYGHHRCVTPLYRIPMGIFSHIIFSVTSVRSLFGYSAQSKNQKYHKIKSGIQIAINQINQTNHTNPGSDNFRSLYYFLTLNDQAIKNSATNSPSLFLPTDFALIALPSPLAIASSITPFIASPSSQVNVVMPVAFLK